MELVLEQGTLGGQRYPRQPGRFQGPFILDHFCFDDAELQYHPKYNHPDQIASIARIAFERLVSTRRPLVVRIVGYADSVGGGPYNRELGLARARQVAKHLRNILIPMLNRRGLRIPVGGIVTSAGESSPVADNRTREGRARNRRVVVSLEFQSNGAGAGGASPAPSTPMPGVQRESEASGYRFNCAGNCPLPGGIAECRRVYRADLAQAIKMARKAARMVANPTQRVGDIYQRIFGHRPNRPVPWAGNARSGSITVKRLRLAASALEKGFFPIACGPCDGFPNANALTTVDGPRTRIEICENYWSNTDRSIRAGILIHETLHAYFEFINDQRDADTPTTVRRTNAHCYEALVMLLHGITPDDTDTTMCRDTPS